MTYTHEQLDTAYNNLPEKLQEFILSDTTEDAINIIADGYDIIDTDKREVLFTDILALASGLGTIEQFAEDMKTECAVPEEQVNALINDVYRVVLKFAYAIGNESSDKTQDDNTYELVEKEPEIPAIAAKNPSQPHVDQYIIGEMELPAGPAKAAVAAPTPQPQTKPASSAFASAPSPSPAKPAATDMGKGIPLRKIEVPRYAPAAKPASAPAYRPQPAPQKPGGTAQQADIPQQPFKHAASILEAKLAGMNSLPSEEIDVSQQKKSGYTSEKAAGDPYREPIE